MRRLPNAVAWPLWAASVLIAGGVYGLETLRDRMRGLRR